MIPILQVGNNVCKQIKPVFKGPIDDDRSAASFWTLESKISIIESIPIVGIVVIVVVRVIVIIESCGFFE